MNRRRHEERFLQKKTSDQSRLFREKSQTAFPRFRLIFGLEYTEEEDQPSGEEGAAEADCENKGKKAN